MNSKLTKRSQNNAGPRLQAGNGSEPVASGEWSLAVKWNCGWRLLVVHICSQCILKVTGLRRRWATNLILQQLSMHSSLQHALSQYLHWHIIEDTSSISILYYHCKSQEQGRSFFVRKAAREIVNCAQNAIRD